MLTNLKPVSKALIFVLLFQLINFITFAVIRNGIEVKICDLHHVELEGGESYLDEHCNLVHCEKDFSVVHALPADPEEKCETKISRTENL
jgi:hypothetical protein